MSTRPPRPRSAPWSRSWLIAALAGALSLACAHAKVTGDGSAVSGKDAQSPAEKKGTDPKSAARAEKAAATLAKDEKAAAKAEKEAARAEKAVAEDQKEVAKLKDVKAPGKDEKAAATNEKAAATDVKAAVTNEKAAAKNEQAAAANKKAGTATSPARASTALAPSRATGGSGAAGKAPPGHPALADTPAELRKPGGTEKLERALADNGYLSVKGHGSRVSEEELSVAIRRFQKAENLAATGFADSETLRRLGLDPKEVDRSLSPRNEPTSPETGLPRPHRSH